jgi:hypothetical protein
MVKFNKKKRRLMIVDDESDVVKTVTDGHITTDGDEGPFGYGIITDKGLEAVIVTTTVYLNNG